MLQIFVSFAIFKSTRRVVRLKGWLVMEKERTEIEEEIILKLLEEHLTPAWEAGFGRQQLDVSKTEKLMVRALLKALRAMAVSRKERSIILSGLQDIRSRIKASPTFLSGPLDKALTRSIKAISAKGKIASTVRR